ncbi:MAG: VWA domain-containing protein [Planctomycetes bacterium]|nr:VWA domain-containing protein [Planctomycetota bacterium]
MIRFAVVEAWMLLPLAVLVLRARLWPRPLTGLCRVLFLIAVCALLAQPWVAGAEDGRDVVVVLDRSRSMPPQATGQAIELADQLAARMQPGDRLGVVTFGRKPAVDLVPMAPFHWPQFAREIDVDGSDLAAAVTAGLSLVGPGRRGSLLVVSDGEHTGGDLQAAARAALRQGVRVDAVLLAREPRRDVAIADVMAPAAVAVGEPFVLSAVVTAGDAGPAHYRLLVDGEVAREGDIELVAGRNVMQFRRAPTEAGLNTFAVEVERDGDPVPQNDRGLAVVRGIAPARVLVITPGGREDRLTRSLRALGLEVRTSAPLGAPLSLDALDAVRCVVLEDVAAGDLPHGSLPVLASWVRDLGGGLLMTGGNASFGVGGYHKTAVEDVLPVTMEMREEQRRFGLAMAIALDRSGSMSATTDGGESKMQLADRGAATAVELLSAMDSVAVIAVDSAPHVVVEMQPLTDKAAVSEQVRSIESMGGGIYIGEALHECARQLATAAQQNRHIVLFADAADSEQPEDYETFVPELVKAGVTVSVIGLGAATDSDGALLERIAELGNGRCQFVSDAADLPRVFAQETIQVARSAMVEEPTEVEVRPALSAIGEMPTGFPQVSGYSLAWPRPRAEIDLLTRDEHEAPMLSHWQIGLGRAAAFLGEVDGQYSGGLMTWDRYADFFGTLVRWLGGGQTPGVHVEAHREADLGLISIEVERELASVLDEARGVLTTPTGHTEELVFERLTEARLLARVPLAAEGVYRAALQIAGVTVRVPPQSLPYSNDFAPQPDPRGGERTLRKLALLTGGRLMPSADQVMAGSRASTGRRDLTLWCAIAALILFFAEIVVRRFGIELPMWRAKVGTAGEPAEVRAPKPRQKVEAKAVPPPAPEAKQAGVLDALERASRRRTRR